MALVIVLIVLTAAWALSYLWLNQEVVSQETHNPEGSAVTALVVYHPGRGSFHRRVVAGFIEGLVAGGWRVTVATASAQAPTNPSEYDLLVLGSPTYWFAPSAVIRRYLRRLGDLGGQPMVTIITGLGAGGRSNSIMQKMVRQANGVVLKALLLYRLRPNDDDNYVNGEQNRTLAVEMATQAAGEIALPGK
jgi:hypothetical protein